MIPFNGGATMSELFTLIEETPPAGGQAGLGWLPDLPDFRDYTEEHPTIQPLLEATGATTPPPALADSMDLRPWCSPIENQGNIGSCTAHAGVGLIEYFERRAFGRHLDASRLFLYKATRNFLRWTGDTGAYLRSTIGAMALFGVPPEEYWPYNTADFDKEPPAFCYAFAQSFQALTYYRLDPPGTDRAKLLKDIKTKLSASLPSMFGFTVYSSISQAATNGEIPFPSTGEKILGGHAVDVVGYDDKKVVKHTASGAQTKGALLIRNSWGTSWGQSGYGWLPYDYVLKGIAEDFWSLVKSEWIETGAFKA
jgi:C1A family cysteine protease